MSSAVPPYAAIYACTNAELPGVVSPANQLFGTITPSAASYAPDSLQELCALIGTGGRDDHFWVIVLLPDGLNECGGIVQFGAEDDDIGFRRGDSRGIGREVGSIWTNR